ncbi:MAG: molybdopterin-guanine dinucleotide biosynthesis protein B [Chloroflexi bacterium]|nr:molybdopterin-guanine dinucleotide biosynthesis protein B [Chloroflexota bacterium]
MTPLVSIVGKSGIGKTTLVEKLVRELKARGLRVAVVKHHAHATPIDPPGKDSWRFAEAGADAVVVSSPAEVARFERVARELTLAEIAARLENVDLILTEGFKREPAPKIEVSRVERGTELVARVDELIAVVSDHPIALPLPRFDLDDAPGVAAFLCERLGL